VRRRDEKTKKEKSGRGGKGKRKVGSGREEHGTGRDRLEERRRRQEKRGRRTACHDAYPLVELTALAMAAILVVV